MNTFLIYTIKLKDMFITSQYKNKCIRDFEDIIVIRKAVKTYSHIKIYYTFDGKEKVLTLSRDKETAEFLKRHEFIWKWRPENGLVRMLTRSFITTSNKKGVIQGEREVPFLWEDIDVTKVSAQNMAACYEYDQVDLFEKAYSMFYYYLPVGTINRLATIG
jgi:hypothetical protein